MDTTSSVEPLFGRVNAIGGCGEEWECWGPERCGPERVGGVHILGSVETKELVGFVVRAAPVSLEALTGLAAAAPEWRIARGLAGTVVAGAEAAWIDGDRCGGAGSPSPLRIRGESRGDSEPAVGCVRATGGLW